LLQAGQDDGQQLLSWWQAQDRGPGAAGEPGRDVDQFAA
jgi:hypothetical protein